MHFKNPILEQLFKSYKWARNNTSKILNEAIKQEILGFHSSSQKKEDYSFQSILFQFQCIVSTTDTYYRRLIGDKNKKFGIYLADEKVIPKQELSTEHIEKILPKQLKDLENLLKTFDEEKTTRCIDKVSLITSHEYLHQGQLILMFREADAKLPESYVRSWAL